MDKKELEAIKILQRLRARREALRDVPLSTSDVVDAFEHLERRRQDEQDKLPKTITF